MERTIEDIEAAFCSASIGPSDSDRALICGFARTLGLQVPAGDYLLCLYHIAAAVVFVREIQAGNAAPAPDIQRRLDLILK